MCDYSLQMVKSRDAAIEDKLVTHAFGYGTVGFAEVGASTSREEATALCIRPGTEIAFDEPIKYRDVSSMSWDYITSEHKTARFRQINTDVKATHHDVLETPDGVQIKLAFVEAGQIARVLQLPAAPQNDKEVAEQTRCEYVG